VALDWSTRHIPTRRAGDARGRTCYVPSPPCRTADGPHSKVSGASGCHWCSRGSGDSGFCWWRVFVNRFESEIELARDFASVHKPTS
jgi:hypothetical protein